MIWKKKLNNHLMRNEKIIKINIQTLYQSMHYWIKMYYLLSWVTLYFLDDFLCNVGTSVLFFFNKFNNIFQPIFTLWWMKVILGQLNIELSLIYSDALQRCPTVTPYNDTLQWRHTMTWNVKIDFIIKQSEIEFRYLNKG